MEILENKHGSFDVKLLEATNVDTIKNNQLNMSSSDCLVFKSPQPFTISAYKNWDGIIEYSFDKIKWHN